MWTTAFPDSLKGAPPSSLKDTKNKITQFISKVNEEMPEAKMDVSNFIEMQAWSQPKKKSALRPYLEMMQPTSNLLKQELMNKGIDELITEKELEDTLKGLPEELKEAFLKIHNSKQSEEIKALASEMETEFKNQENNWFKDYRKFAQLQEALDAAFKKTRDKSDSTMYADIDSLAESYKEAVELVEKKAASVTAGKRDTDEDKKKAFDKLEQDAKDMPPPPAPVDPASTANKLRGKKIKPPAPAPEERKGLPEEKMPEFYEVPEDPMPQAYPMPDTVSIQSSIPSVPEPSKPKMTMSIQEADIPTPSTSTSNIPRERFTSDNKSMSQLIQDIIYFYNNFKQQLRPLASQLKTIFTPKGKLKKGLKMPVVLRLHRRIVSILSPADAQSGKRTGVVIDAEEYIKQRVNEIMIEKAMAQFNPEQLRPLEGEDKKKGESDVGNYMIKKAPSGLLAAQREPIFKFIPTTSDAPKSAGYGSKSRTKAKVVLPSSKKRNLVTTARMELNNDPFLSKPKTTRINKLF